MNKVLLIRGIMVLPDDFKGTLADGLQLLADLRRKEEKAQPDIVKAPSDPQHILNWNATFVELHDKQKTNVELTLGEIKHSEGRMSLASAVPAL